jgi:hypothetical protein
LASFSIVTTDLAWILFLRSALALPYAPKLIERFKAPPSNKEELQSLREQIELMKTQLAQLAQSPRPTS